MPSPPRWASPARRSASRLPAATRWATRSAGRSAATPWRPRQALGGYGPMVLVARQSARFSSSLPTGEPLEGRIGAVSSQAGRGPGLVLATRQRSTAPGPSKRSACRSGRTKCAAAAAAKPPGRGRERGTATSIPERRSRAGPGHWQVCVGRRPPGPAGRGSARVRSARSPWRRGRRRGRQWPARWRRR